MDDCSPDQLPDTVELSPQPILRISRQSGIVHYVSKWCGPYDDALKRKVVTEGKSFARAAFEINEQFGTRFTRNAGIGRAGRMGLKSPNRPSAIHKFALPSIKHERGHNLDGLHAARRLRTGPPKPRATCKAEPVQLLHISFADLQPCHCRWPHGDGPFTFCGHPKFANSSYCESHAALSINPRAE